jgi:geranylgeranyl reductase family protein
MEYDVVIVGAGPAGSTAAKILAEHNISVLLIEKDTFPRDKPCGGGIPFRAFHTYPYIDTPSIVEAYIYGGSAFSPSNTHEIKIRKDTPLIATTLRKIFDHELVKIAQQKGAHLKEGTTVTTITIRDKNATVTLEDNTQITTNIIIGADGVHRIIAKQSGLRKKETRMGICILQEFPLDKPTLDHYFTPKRYCIIHSRFRNMPGYGWVFPKKQHLNIGMGCIGLLEEQTNHKMNLKNLYKEYITFLQKNNYIPPDLPTLPIIGAALPIHPLPKTYSNRILLVGDAAGFINPLTGEGIYYAMRSGHIAGDLLVQAIQQNKTDELFLSNYQKIWRKDFGKDLDIIYAIHRRPNKHSREKLFEIAEKDQQLSDLLMRVIAGELSIKKYQGKLIRRYFYTFLKSKIIK